MNQLSSGAFGSRLFDARLILRAGLGGLLVLMAAGGIFSTLNLKDIRQQNEAIQRRFLDRNRTLNQFRSDLYLSSTYVRDYLLDPSSESAAGNRVQFEAIQAELNELAARYKQSGSPDQGKRWRELDDSLDQYWRRLQPVWNWDQETRGRRGYEYFRDEILPRRSHLLSIADEVGTLNEQQLRQGADAVDALFGSVERKLLLTLILTLAGGAALAYFASARVLALERRASQNYQEVVAARSALQELSARLVSAQEEERRTISRELHDEVGQSLSALLVGLSNLRASMAPGVQPQFDEKLSGVRSLAEGTVAVVRNLALLLRPSMLDDLGLVEALQWQARETSRQHNVDVRVRAEGLVDDVPDEHKTCLYRVVQETLHNAVRHGQPTEVTIFLEGVPGELRLQMKDNGRGFAPNQQRGLGLLGMEERVTHLGGVFELKSQPGLGTEIRVRLPFSSQRQESA